MLGGPRVGLDFSKKRITTCPKRIWTPGRPVHSLVAIPTPAAEYFKVFMFTKKIKVNQSAFPLAGVVKLNYCYHYILHILWEIYVYKFPLTGVLRFNIAVQLWDSLMYETVSTQPEVDRNTWLESTARKDVRQSQILNVEVQLWIHFGFARPDLRAVRYWYRVK
jgi:hypothetical protein